VSRKRPIFVLLSLILTLKDKGFPYLLPSVGPEADPGVQAVSRQTVSHPPGGIGWHYFPPGLRLPFQQQSITARWLVPSYIAW